MKKLLLKNFMKATMDVFKLSSEHEKNLGRDELKRILRNINDTSFEAIDFAGKLRGLQENGRHSRKY